MIKKSIKKCFIPFIIFQKKILEIRPFFRPLKWCYPLNPWICCTLDLYIPLKSTNFQIKNSYMEENSLRNKLLNIIVIICDVHFVTFFYIFKVHRTVMDFLTFGMSQIITIILNGLQLVNMSQFC